MKRHPQPGRGPGATGPRLGFGLGLAACVAVAVLAVLGGGAWRDRGRSGLAADGAQGAAGPDYSHAPATWSGRDACRACHADADRDWTGSDHDLAMQLPGPATITADFDSATSSHFDVTTFFYRRGPRYFVRTDGPDGAPTDYPIAYVFGHDPLEQFLIRFPDGRLQALNVCWDTRPADEGGQRWFHLYPGERTPAGDLFHWTGVLQNWNTMCAECHSTNVRRNYDPDTDTYATTWSEIDVSCEACHGPGSRHITFERAAARGLRPRDDDGRRGLVVDLASPDDGTWVFEPGRATAVRTAPLAGRVEAEACARCHARRSPLTDAYAYGRPFLDQYRLELLAENLYEADGQNRDEVYVYGSFLQSKMHAAGVTCGDCHDPHSTRTRGTGNQVCARCHRAEVFDTPAHHFHRRGAGGGSCLDCHQQARRVMVVDARRDHSFRIPRPDLSLALGTPNACSDCHADKPVQWARDAIVEWYGPDRRPEDHYAAALLSGRTGAPGAAERLRGLVAAPDQPAIVRATAWSLLPAYGPTADLPEVTAALRDTAALVRAEAVRSLATSPPRRQAALAVPLLDDGIRVVRLAAARLVALLPTGTAAAADLSRARRLWEQHLEGHLERPETWLERAALQAAAGQAPAAEASFRRAIALVPAYAPSYLNYADFLRRSGRPLAAADVLREGIAVATDPADLHHALGLDLVRAGDQRGALVELGRAAALRPRSARLGYVHAVALHDAGETAASLDALDRVLDAQPWHRDSLQALALYALEAGEPERGRTAVARLSELFPGDAQLQELQARFPAAPAR